MEQVAFPNFQWFLTQWFIFLQSHIYGLFTSKSRTNNFNMKFLFLAILTSFIPQQIIASDVNIPNKKTTLLSFTNTSNFLLNTPEFFPYFLFRP